MISPENGVTHISSLCYGSLSPQGHPLPIRGRVSSTWECRVWRYVLDFSRMARTVGPQLEKDPTSPTLRTEGSFSTLSDYHHLMKKLRVN